MELATLPQRRRLTPDARRAELLHAGERVFAERPYEDVSIEQIAETAGVSKNLLYHYFTGKRELYLETIRAATNEMLSRTDPDPSLPPIEALRASVDRHLVYVEEHADGYIRILRGAGGDAEVQAIVTAARQRVVDRSVAALPLNGAPPPPALLLALHGWTAFIDEVSMTWLEHPALDRLALREMLVRQFVAVVKASGSFDRR
ncbi:MAG TPA: helix-turn-helix domain-containing protein [Thermoleophilaceae bacterium]